MSESRLLLADNVLTREPPATCHEHVMDTCWLSKQMFTDCQSIDWFTITYYLLLAISLYFYSRPVSGHCFVMNVRHPGTFRG